MGLKLTVPPGEEPVTLAEAKHHLRVDVADDDALIGVLITAARKQAEQLIGRVLVTQTWEMSLNAFPRGKLLLPMSPLRAVHAVRYLDTSGAEQVLPAGAYQVVADEMVGGLLPAYGTSWPACRSGVGGVVVNFEAGFGEAADVPEPIRVWMLLAIGVWYRNREAVTASQTWDLPRAFWDALLDPYRVYL